MLVFPVRILTSNSTHVFLTWSEMFVPCALFEYYHEERLLVINQIDYEKITS